jgi:membrane protease YdiL (CAAX protease family)
VTGATRRAGRVLRARVRVVLAAWLPATLASRGLLGWELPPELSRLLGTFGPSLAALLVTAATSGRRGLRALLARLAIWRVGVGWYAVALLWPAAHSLATTGVHVLLGAAPPDFAQPPVLWLYPAPPELFAAGSWPLLPFVFIQSLLSSSSLGEEPGWRGFALPRLQARFGALGASLVLGVLWGVWHLPLALTRGDPTEGTFSGWYLLGSTGDAVLYTWLFNATGGACCWCCCCTRQ